jgi:hypothetical protein
MLNSIGGYLCQLVVMACLLVFFVVKIVAAMDDGGEIKKTASDGFAECFRKIFKK